MQTEQPLIVLDFGVLPLLLFLYLLNFIFLKIQNVPTSLECDMKINASCFHLEGTAHGH